MTVSRRPVAMPPKNCRTRVGTGARLFLEDLDERGIHARRFREVFAQIVVDLGCDPSEAQTQLARRAASLSVWSETVEARLAQGEDIDAPEFATVSNALRRLFADLGIRRVPRDITPSLDNYLERRQSGSREISA